VDAPPDLRAHLFDDVELPPPPEDADPRFQEAEQLVRAGRAAEAGVALGELLAQAPDCKPARALMHVVAALSASGRPDFARAELEAALAEDPSCLEAAALLERAEDQQAVKRHAVLQRILPDRPGAPGKREIIEAIVLAFTHSEASELVGTDALRMVLDGQYVDMVQQPGTLDLAPLWALLNRQPGFQADHALPPLYRLKSWERALKRTVTLPGPLEQLGAVERERLAARCPVPEGKLERALRPAAQTPPRLDVPRPTPRALARAAAAATTTKLQVVEVVTPTEQKRNRRVLLAAGLSLLVLAFSLFLTFSGGPSTVAPASLGDSIPIAEAHLSGDVVGIILKDSSWLGRPLDERRRTLVETLEHAQSLGATGVVVMDTAGVVRAMASSPPDATDKPNLTFP